MIVNPIWWLKISIATGRQDHKRVVDLAMRALEKNPQNLSALNFAATNLEAIGDLESARDHAKRSLAIDPDNFNLHCLLIRNLNPAKDMEALLEHAKWLVAISETTLPQEEIELEKAAAALGRLPFTRNLASGAEHESMERRHYQSGYLQWAKDYLTSHNASPA